MSCKRNISVPKIDILETGYYDDNDYNNNNSHDNLKRVFSLLITIITSIIIIIVSLCIIFILSLYNYIRDYIY
jgi:hypothetical protein